MGGKPHLGYRILASPRPVNKSGEMASVLKLSPRDSWSTYVAYHGTERCGSAENTPRQDHREQLSLTSRILQTATNIPATQYKERNDLQQTVCHSHRASTFQRLHFIRPATIPSTESSMNKAARTTIT